MLLAGLVGYALIRNVRFSTISDSLAQSRPEATFGQKQSKWQELLDSLADNINYVDGPVLSYSQIVSHLELAVIVAKSAEYSFRLAS